MSGQMSFLSLLNATSSQALGDGRMRCGLPDGKIDGRSGQDLHRASHSASQGWEAGQMTSDILPPTLRGWYGMPAPPVLFGEQVASAAVFGKVAKPSKRRDPEAPEWAWLDDLSDRLEAAHYAVGASDIPAAGIGAPHIRQRTFFGAYDLRLVGGRVADPNGAKPQQSARQGAMPDETPGARAHCQSDGSSHVGGMGNADGRNPCAEREPTGGQHGLQPTLHGPGGMGIADGKTVRGITGGQSRTKKAGEHRAHPDDVSRSSDVVERPGPLDGFWANADWLFCRDDKWRPVEPGTFPLAHGLSDRVGLLRGYGNAICPQAAAAFLEVIIEIIFEMIGHPDSRAR